MLKLDKLKIVWAEMHSTPDAVITEKNCFEALAPDRWYPDIPLTFHLNKAFCMDLTHMDSLCKQLFLSFYCIPVEALEAQRSVFFYIIPLCHLPARELLFYSSSFSLTMCIFCVGGCIKHPLKLGRIFSSLLYSVRGVHAPCFLPLADSGFEPCTAWTRHSTF